MITYPTIVLANSSDIAIHLAKLADQYARVNGILMPAIEQEFFEQLLSDSVLQHLGFMMKDSFVYLLDQPEYRAIVAVGFHGSPIEDAYLLASVISQHQPHKYLTLGTYFADLLPFIHPNSIRKWRMNHSDKLTLLPLQQCDQLLEYLDV